MKRLLMLMALLMVLSLTAEAQKPSRKVRKAVARSEKVEENQKKAYEKAVRKDRERRFKMQNPEVQERMKENRKKAKSFNRANKEPFYKKIFRKRRK